MKVAMALVAAALAVVLSMNGATAVSFRGATVAHHKALSSADRPITKVVKMLQGMLEKSEEEGNEDRKIYAKLKCYCDTNKEEKTQDIAKLSNSISMLESEIEELQGDNGVLSSECAQLTSDIDENIFAQKAANKTRKEENDAYKAFSKDAKLTIGYLGLAIDTLSEIGADQSLDDAAQDHKQMMAGFKGIQLSAKVKQALEIARTFIPQDKQRKYSSFLQARAPFTGSYSAQSGEIVGLLKNMKDTTAANLKEATKTENDQNAAWEKFILEKVRAEEKMKGMLSEKEAKLGENDSALSTARDNKKAAEKSKATAEEFLEEMIPMCQKKAKEYQDRVLLRTQEEQALSKAIAILDSDEAFELMGKVSATSSFIQRSMVHNSSPNRLKAAQLLQSLARGGRNGKTDLRLLKVVEMLKGGNPFDKILEEIDNMVELIDKEGDADKENLDWCNDERTETDKSIKAKEKDITDLTGTKNQLTSDINHPQTGLKVNIKTTEESLAQCLQSQSEETEQRKKEHEKYEKDAANYAATEELLAAAIKVLNDYYSKMEDQAVEQVETFAGEKEARPETWEKEGGYQGQEKDGNKAIQMLEYIETETKKESDLCHQTENDAQHMYEDSMAGLKKQQKDDQDNLADLKDSLAKKEKELEATLKDLKATKKEKQSLIEYKEEIKPGCDFITQEFDYREQHRKAEKDGLDKAKSLIKGTPVYKQAVEDAHLESMGDCKDICVEEGEDHVKCKACLAEVTVPGYCAGHDGTKGC